MSINRKAKLIRVSPKTFIIGERFEYTLYQHKEDEIYIKFLPKDEEYDLKALKFIESNNIKHLYVTHEDFKKYIKKGGQYLKEVVKDKNLDLIIKSEIMYQLFCETMFDVLSGDITKEKIDEISKNVSIAVELISIEPNATKSLIQATTHDYETYTHSVDVATYALGFGSYLGFKKDELLQLTVGAMLHDIGKKRIPEEIISKNGTLSDQEYRIIKNHPSYGIDILREVGVTNDSILAIVEEHHEKMDGSGYPRALSGDKIHIFAQIVSICDIFNAITTKRTYKDQKKSFDAFKLMHTKMKNELNPKLFAKFIAFMGDR